MAYFRMAKAFNSSGEFELFGDGTAIRDFTFIEDVSEAIERLIPYGLQLQEGTNQVFNIGGGNPRTMAELIEIMADCFQGKGSVKRSDFYALDMLNTVASTENLERAIGYLPSTTLEHGIRKFIDWFQQPEVKLRISEWN
jgi:UDP-glucuronate 4-epimerase